MDRNQHPPKVLLRIFRWFCHPEFVEDIEGDLIERFEKIARDRGGVRARGWFALEVLLLFRRELLNPLEGRQRMNYYGMFKNFVKIGYRNLIRQKEYTAFNIVGLAMGLAMTFLTGLWVLDELSFDVHHQDYKRIAQVLKRRTHNGEIGIRFSLPIPVVDELRNSYADDFEYVVVTDWIGKNILSSTDKNLNVSGCYMSEDAPALLSLKMLSGTRNGLSNKYGIMLSASAANAFFGDQDPLGEQMKVNGESIMQVVGVYQDLPYNSTFRDLKFIANFSAIEANDAWVQRARSERYWNASFCQIYVKLHEQADLAVVEEKIRHMISANTDNERLKASNPELVLHTMKDWHLRSDWKNGVQSGGLIEDVWIFGSVALFVLILSCINFINLSTARSQVRSKEVGLRKTMGSRRIQLITQFITESILVVTMAFFLAMLMSHLLMPFFNELSGKNLTIPLFNPWFWAVSIAVLFVTALLAGTYPAFVLSAFRPVDALKGKPSRQGSYEYLRHALVVVQFVVSICLVVGTMVVNDQVSHSKNRDKGYDQERLITINTSAKDFDGKHKILHAALMSTGVVNSMSQSSNPLTEVTSSNGGFSWAGKDPALATNFNTIRVTPEFGKTVQWKLLEGRDFSGELSSDEKGLVCNRAAIDFMSLENPIGSTVSWRDKTYRVIGVVEDILVESPFLPVRPTVYFIDPSEVQYMQIRLLESANSQKALAKVEEVFKAIVPHVPFDFQYVDYVFSRKFMQEERLGRLLGVLTIVAIVIGIMGILGLSAYVVRQRSKEMSIRKVLGASLASILSLLFSEFIRTILVALFISIPMAWYLLEKWLQGYEYRINVSLWYFITTGICYIALTLMLIGKRSLQVARSNPTKFLKDE